MATKTDIELKIVDSVDTFHTEAEVLTDSASNPDAFYVGRGYLAHNGEKVIEGIDPNGSYPNMTVGNAQKAKEAESATHADTATDLSGRVEATPEVFTYRPSAGEKSIKDDNAFIRRVKGNSVVWNQLVDSNTLFIGERNGMVISKNEDGSITFNGTASADIFYNLANLRIPIGHKVALTGVDNMSPFTFFLNGGVGNTLTSSGILTCSHIITDGNRWMFLYINANTTFNNVTINPKIHYLTRMFGIGNEPNTIEEFRALYPDSNYPYNTGELRNLNCYGIKTVGFNQWDEQWEYGNIDSYTGVTTALSNCIRSANFIPVIGGKSYYFGKKDGAEIGLYVYDDTYNFIGVYTSGNFVPSVGTGKVTNRSILLPTNAKYIKFRVFPYTTSTSVNDICINLSHTGVRDGDYEPYKEVTHALPLSQITNGQPLRKAWNAYDEINEAEYIKRVGVVDLGSLNWRIYTPSTDVYYADIPTLGFVKDFISISNLLSTKFTPAWLQDVLNDTEQNNIYSSHPTSNTLYVRASGYDNEYSFKSAMSGIMLNYELAEPIVTPIETPIDFNYYVEDFGTEEALLAEDSAPFSADIVYQFNAVDNIRQNRISIQKLNDIFSGSKGEYVRADGSWGYIADLKGNFFVKPTLKRIRTGISELSDTIQIIHPYLTEHIGDAKIVLMAVKRRGGSYYDRATNAKGRRKKRKAWGELHYAAMPNTEINHNTIEMTNGASFEAWQSVILTACGRIPEGLENAREPYNVNVASEDLADFFAANGAIFVGKTPVIRLGVALRIPNPNFIDYGNGNKMWDYNDVTGKWEYKYLYSDVAEVVVKSQMLRTGGYVLGLELV